MAKYNIENANIVGDCEIEGIKYNYYIFSENNILQRIIFIDDKNEEYPFAGKEEHFENEEELNKLINKYSSKVVSPRIFDFSQSLGAYTEYTKFPDGNICLSDYTKEGKRLLSILNRDPSYIDRIQSLQLKKLVKDEIPYFISSDENVIVNSNFKGIEFEYAYVHDDNNVIKNFTLKYNYKGQEYNHEYKLDITQFRNALLKMKYIRNPAKLIAETKSKEGYDKLAAEAIIETNLGLNQKYNKKFDESTFKNFIIYTRPSLREAMQYVIEKRIAERIAADPMQSIENLSNMPVPIANDKNKQIMHGIVNKDILTEEEQNYIESTPIPVSSTYENSKKQVTDAKDITEPEIKIQEEEEMSEKNLSKYNAFQEELEKRKQKKELKDAIDEDVKSKENTSTSTLEEILNQNKMLEEENNALKELIATLKEAIEKLKKEIEQIKQEHFGHDKEPKNENILDSSTKEILEQNKLLKEENAKLKETIVSLNKTVEDLKKEIEQIKQNNVVQENPSINLKKIKKEVEELQSHSKEILNENNKLKTANKELEEKNQGLSEQNAQLLKSIALLKSENEKMQEHLAETETEYSKMQEVNERLLNNLRRCAYGKDDDGLR